jgi:hypothetical protein
MPLSTRAATLKQEIGAALNKELEIARKASSGERANDAKDGVQTRKKGNSFVYEFEELTGYPPDEGVQVSFTVGEKTSKGRYLGEINSKFVFEFDDDLDSDETSSTSVTNGLSLCKIHHTAYDINIVGIDADYTVHIRQDVLSETDGPMLEHGIKEMDKTKLWVPPAPGNQPDPARLEKRFLAFSNQ